MTDTIQRFLEAETGQRRRIAAEPDAAAELAAYFGAEAWAELAALPTPGGGAHLAASAPPNLVFVPGVMGSMLQGKWKPGIWWFDLRTRGHLNDLRLNPAGDSSENPDNEVEPATADPSYEPFAVAMLAQDDFGHRTFPYDWRKPLALSTGRLRDLVVRCHDENGGRPVHLVAHSMGGLVVRATLMEHGGELWPRVGRIVFAGTPHYGSAAIAGYLKNHLWGWEPLALLGRYLNRATFRSLHGVLGMLPAPAGIYPGTTAPAPGGEYVHPCANFDLYRAESWRLDLDGAETSRLQKVLDGAAELHRRMHEWHLGLLQEQRERMLVIAGVGYRTLFRLAYDRAFFGLWERAEKITSRIPGDPDREGDGRVPQASATLKDVEIRYVRGVHGGLTNIPAVSQEIFRWLRGQPLQLPQTPQGALSQHLAGDERSTAPHLDLSHRADPYGDDPRYWSVDHLTEPELDLLDQRADSGQLPDFALIKIF